LDSDIGSAAGKTMIKSIVIDCADLERQAAFWAAATGYHQAGSDGHYAALVHPDTSHRHPRLLLQKVPEPKMGKNRVHLDLAADDLAADVERLVARGASQGQSYQEYDAVWTVMTDPEGTEFCVCARVSRPGPRSGIPRSLSHALRAKTRRSL
jgi:predicted enzyme related to lactoylglutathione lyase